MGPLVKALSDAQPLVRGHAAWALGQVGEVEGLEAVAVRLEWEDDAFVRGEVTEVLATNRELSD